jgi:uncharacterized protein (DUF1697 family)
MTTYIALLRGINLLGHNRLPMKELKRIIEQCGCIDVQTYIQSGNVIFRSGSTDTPRLAKQLAAAVSRSHGFEPRVLVLTQRLLTSAAAANPFPEAEANPATVHLFFLAERPRKPDLGSIEALRTKTERFALKGNVFYLHTPDGFGSSKLAKRAERLLGVDATARNWRTVTTLLDLARGGVGTYRQ